MIKFPYGIADFAKIISEGCYYCDRTHAIPALEQTQSQLFIRPRRFGKSLLLSMLENYYDIARKDQFEALFGKLAIGRQTTAWHNHYFILRWDFSCVDPTGTPDDIKRSLYNHINSCIEDLIQTYRFNGFDLPIIHIDRDDALYSIKSLISGIKTMGHPIYLLIDEYDNFANTVMMLPVHDAQARYQALVHDEGIMRTLFKVVKSATNSAGFDRVFITGVTPVVMSDITSGYNIAKNIFLKPEFSHLCGLRDTEIKAVLDRIARDCDWDTSKAAQALAEMRTWYNGYNFCPRQAEKIYNPTLCLYFFDELQSQCAYPRKMLDANLAADDEAKRERLLLGLERVPAHHPIRPDHVRPTWHELNPMWAEWYFELARLTDDPEEKALYR